MVEDIRLASTHWEKQNLEYSLIVKLQNKRKQSIELSDTRKIVQNVMGQWQARATERF